MSLDSIKNKINNDDNKPRILTGLEALKEEAKEIEHILFPWLNSQGLVLLFAERGVGKTHVALNSAHAITIGGEYLEWYADKPRRVLYVDGEMQFSFLKKRYESIVTMYPPDDQMLLANFNLITPDKYRYGIPDVASPEGQKIIDQHLEETNSEVLIIDNLACLMPSIKSNDNDAWRAKAQHWILRLRKEGKSIILVNHAGKFKKDEIPTSRGASGKDDVLDSVILLSKPAGYEASQGARFKVEFTKNRNFFGTDADPFEAWLKEDHQGNSQWFRNEISKSNYELTCDFINQGKKQAEIAKVLKKSKGYISQLVKKGIQEGKIKEVENIFCNY